MEINLQKLLKITTVVENIIKFKEMYKKEKEKKFLLQKDKTLNLYFKKVIKKKIKKCFNEIFKRRKYLHNKKFDSKKNEFYEEIEKLKDEKFGLDDNFEKIILNKTSRKVDLLFSKTEKYGKCIDIEHIFVKYKDIMKKEKHSDYLENILNVENSNYLYFLYLNELCEYFEDYSKRKNPFLSKNKLQKLFKKNKSVNNLNNEDELKRKNLNEFFESRILCQGCNLFLMKKMLPFHEKSKKHIKVGQNKYKQIEFNELEILEAKIQYFINKLNNEINISKCLIDVEEIELSENKEESDKKVYSVEKCKDMPSWLVKYYGMNISFYCEICKNKKIKGKKQFIGHFKENEHLTHLRELTYENENYFYGITTVRGVENMKKRLKIENNTFIEEIEDDEGNVYDLKTYNDLKKLGII